MIDEVPHGREAGRQARILTRIFGPEACVRAPETPDGAVPFGDDSDAGIVAAVGIDGVFLPIASVLSMSGKFGHRRTTRCRGP